MRSASRSIGEDRGQSAVAVEAVCCAAENGSEVETEAVDAGIADEMAQAVDDEPLDVGMVAGNAYCRCRYR